MHHQRCAVDRRSVRVRLTPKGQAIRLQIGELFDRHAAHMQKDGIVDMETMDRISHGLRRIERFWGEQIRYIY